MDPTSNQRPDSVGAPRSHHEPRLELLYAQAVRLAGLGAWSVELATNELWWSEEVFRIHELPVGKIPTVAEAIAFYAPDARSQIEAGLARLMSHGEPYDLELPLVTAQGRTIWIRTIGDLERSNDGQPLRLYGVIKDITARHIAREALLVSEQRMHLALKGSEDGVWDWNVADSTVYFSPRWKEILGYADHELENSFDVWARLVHGDDLAATMSEVESVLAGHSDVYRVQFRMRHRDGSWRWILARAKAVARDATRRATRLVGTHSDVTEQVRLQEELVRATTDAEAAARAKAEFLATMSHEIRTPMNGVLGMAQLLEATQLDREQREMVETIRTSGQSLLVILNDILDLSKVDSGRLELESIAFDLRRVLDDVCALLAPQARAKGLELRLIPAPEARAKFCGDPARLRQVVLNLVGNAIKFTEHGVVTLRASVATAPDAAGLHRVAIEVEDTGIGIAASQRGRLFESFSQGDRSTTRRYGGAGLGLAISRRLVELMGGTLDFVSEFGRGSRFTVEVALPAVDANAGDETGVVRAGAGDTPNAPLPQRSSRPANVLLVEDNPVNQLVARRLLEREGCKVTVANDGQCGVDRARAGRFDLIFMDCHMPVMDGYEAMRRIRAHEVANGTPRTPIIALTANAFAEDRERCFEAGADDHIAKPIDRARLAACVQHWLGEASKRDAPSAGRA